MYSYVNTEVLASDLESNKFKEEDSNSEDITLHSIIVLLISLIIFGGFASFLIYKKIRFA
jgi:hypothetical protein